MATTGTKVPSIYKIPTKADPELKQFANSVKEALEVRLGRRGDPKDRAITLRELIDSGLAKELLDNPFDPNKGFGVTDFAPPTFTSSTIPPTPTGFSASAAYSSFILSWDNPQYNGLAYTEIWRHTIDEVGTSTRIDTTRAFVWSEEVGYNKTYFYWVRHVSTSDVIGPFSPSDTGTTAVDVGAVMTTLSETLASLPGYSVLTDADTAHGVNITNIQNDAGAAYVLQVNSGDGEVGGMVIESSAYGAADNSGSVIQFRADKFAIWNATGSDAGASSVAPFIVDTGVVYIDMARIKDAAITDAKIGDLAAGKINAGYLAAARIQAGSLDAAKITTNTLNVAGIAVDGTLGRTVASEATVTDYTYWGYVYSTFATEHSNGRDKALLATPLPLVVPATTTGAAKSFITTAFFKPIGTSRLWEGYEGVSFVKLIVSTSSNPATDSAWTDEEHYIQVGALGLSSVPLQLGFDLTTSTTGTVTRYIHLYGWIAAVAGTGYDGDNDLSTGDLGFIGNVSVTGLYL
jgi:hypothetical protein